MRRANNDKHKRPNALNHGVFATTAILPGEDPREFAMLYSGLIEEWSPDGPSEWDAVHSLALNMWRKARIQKFFRLEQRDAAMIRNIHISTRPKHFTPFITV
jgi:hypothetical protein